MTRLTIVICTHNRSALLQRTLRSINEAEWPQDGTVEILVVANACTDDTIAVLKHHESQCHRGDSLALRWTEEPTPGKSYALNRAIPMIDDGLVAFVDDDHRIERGYLVNMFRAARRYPDATLLCGRILPDWDGSEPKWGVFEQSQCVHPRFF